MSQMWQLSAFECLSYVGSHELRTKQSFVESQKPHCDVMTEHGQFGLKALSDCLLKQAKDNIKSCLKWAGEGHEECPWEVEGALGGAGCILLRSGYFLEGYIMPKTKKNEKKKKRVKILEARNTLPLSCAQQKELLGWGLSGN